MKKNEYGIHRGHCCAIHGCKYSEEDCPVINKQIQQAYTCEDCDYEGYRNVKDVEKFLLYQEEIEKAKLNGTEEISVNIEFLELLMKK